MTSNNIDLIESDKSVRIIDDIIDLNINLNTNPSNEDPSNTDPSNTDPSNTDPSNEDYNFINIICDDGVVELYEHEFKRLVGKGYMSLLSKLNIHTNSGITVPFNISDIEQSIRNTRVYDFFNSKLDSDNKHPVTDLEILVDSLFKTIRKSEHFNLIKIL